MNDLIIKESCFLRLLLDTNNEQRNAMIKTITQRQLKVVVQIAYNVLQGAREVSRKDINRLIRHRLVIHRFIDKQTTHVRRVGLLLKYLDIILPLIKTVEADLK